MEKQLYGLGGGSLGSGSPLLPAGKTGCREKEPAEGEGSQPKHKLSFY